MFWPCTAPHSGGQRLGNTQGGLCPNTSIASESFMQTFSHTSFQDLLVGHCLTMHSYSYGTTLTMPRRRTTKPPQPGSQGLGDQQIWLVTAIFCSTQPQALALGEDVSSLEAFPGQKSGWPVPVWVAAHGESEIRLQISRSLCELCHFSASIVSSSLAPANADPAVKPALIPTAPPASPWSAWASAVFLVSTQASSSYK